MPTKKTPEQHRSDLIDVILTKICPGLKYRRYGYAFEIEFAKLDSRDVVTFITDHHTETDRFGRLLNDLKKEFFMKAEEKALVHDLWNAFWWPAVDKVWPLQCFEVPTNDEGVNRLYLLARTAPDEWVGVTTRVCYLDEQ